MSKLIALYEQLNANYEEYLADNHQLPSLVKNILLFKTIKNDELVQILKTATLSDLEICNKALLIVAKSYTACAFAMQNKDSAQNLAKAERCYSLVSKYIGEFPPYNLSHALGKQSTEAKFYIHKTKFNQAKIELFALKEQLESNSIDLKLSEKSLREVIETYNKFQKILAKDYKDSALKAEFSIDAQFSNSIQNECKEAEQLLADVRERLGNCVTAKQPTTSVAVQTSNNANTLKRTLIPQEEESPHVYPSRKRAKRIIEDKEGSMINDATSNFVEDTSTHNLSNSKEKMAEIITEKERATTTETPLMVLSSIATDLIQNSIFRQNPVLTENPASKISPLTQTTAINSSNTFWTNSPMPTPTRDSIKCYNLLNAWVEAYFSKLNVTSNNAKKSLALEKLGRIMLFAAIRLQKESKIFQGKEINPAIRLAVQLFLKTAESKSAEPSAKCLNPILHARMLSEFYSEQLALFSTFFGKEFEPHEHLEELRKQFSKESNLTNMLGLSIEETIGNIFETLAAVCLADDYNKIKDTCFINLNSVDKKLGTEEVHRVGFKS